MGGSIDLPGGGYQDGRQDAGTAADGISAVRFGSVPEVKQASPASRACKAFESDLHDLLEADMRCITEAELKLCRSLPCRWAGNVATLNTVIILTTTLTLLQLMYSIAIVPSVALLTDAIIMIVDVASYVASMAANAALRTRRAGAEVELTVSACSTLAIAGLAMYAMWDGCRALLWPSTDGESLTNVGKTLLLFGSIGLALDCIGLSLFIANSSHNSAHRRRTGTDCPVNGGRLNMKTAAYHLVFDTIRSLTTVTTGILIQTGALVRAQVALADAVAALIIAISGLVASGILTADVASKCSSMRENGGPSQTLNMSKLSEDTQETLNRPSWS